MPMWQPSPMVAQLLTPGHRNVLRAVCQGSAPRCGTSTRCGVLGSHEERECCIFPCGNSSQVLLHFTSTGYFIIASLYSDGFVTRVLCASVSP